MQILVLNGSPRLNGNTRSMVEAFRDGAVSAGHRLTNEEMEQINALDRNEKHGWY